MVNLEERLPQTVILVSDIVDRAAETTSEDDRTLEKSDSVTRDRLAAALRQIVPRVIMADSPQQLFGYSVDRTLVMTIYGGEKSRNRMALVPAACETMGMQFMGADAYARILCQDKYLAKIFARELGLDTPLAVLVRDKADLKMLGALTTPIVVKPNLEGSSIGISRDLFDLGNGPRPSARLRYDYDRLVRSTFSQGRADARASRNGRGAGVARRSGRWRR